MWYAGCLSACLFTCLCVRVCVYNTYPVSSAGINPQQKCQIVVVVVVGFNVLGSHRWHRDSPNIHVFTTSP